MYKNDGEVVLAASDSRHDKYHDWILDSDFSRYLVNDERLLIDGEDCNDEVSLADNEKVRLCKVCSD